MFKLSTISNSATFNLTSDVNPADEGSQVNITLSTTGVQRNQVIPFTISGDVDIDDFNGLSSLSGEMIVGADGNANLTLSVKEDLLTEGPETFTFTIGAGLTSIDVGLTDTSLMNAISNTTLMSIIAGSVHGQTNNTFIDSSSNNLTITRTGNVTQGTFTPFSRPDGEWAVAFNGTTDYLDVSPQFNITSGIDFTIEAWINAKDVTINKVIVGSWQQDATNAYWVFGVISGSLYFSWAPYSTGATFMTGTAGAITVNKWTHVAIVKVGTLFTLYADGVAISQATNSQTKTGTPTQTRIGHYGSGLGPSPTSYFNGSISNLRIVAGTALYTANFTPPTTKLTAVAGTQLLTCQSNRVKDNSANNRTLSTSGTPRVTAFSPFAIAEYNSATQGGGMYFDGAGDWLTVTNNDNTQLGAYNFTLETWIYPTSLTSMDIIGRYATSSSGGIIMYRNTSGAVNLALSSSSSTWNISTGPLSGIAPTNTWTHAALVRNGNTFTLYINGVHSGSITHVGALVQTPLPWTIGGRSESTTWFNGYMSGTRLIVGTAVYTSNFTVPSAPVTAITNTQLLMNGTNAGIFDQSGSVNIETPAGVTVSTTDYPVGYISSINFSGANGAVAPVTPVNTFSVGTGDFTFECWSKLKNTNNDAYFTIFGVQYSGSKYLVVRYSDYGYGNKLQVSTDSASQSVMRSCSITKTSMLNVWAKIAFQRKDGQCSLWVDGVRQNLGSGINPSTYPETSFTSTVSIDSIVNVVVGGSSEKTLQFNGNITDVQFHSRALYD